MDTQEKQEIEKLRKKERYTPLAGWRRSDENGEVLDDPERREIYKYKIMIAEYEERKQNPEFSSLEMQIEINQKIKSLQVDLEKLIDSWQKGGGDGTTG